MPARRSSEACLGRGERNGCEDREQDYQGVETCLDQQSKARKTSLIGNHVGAKFVQASLGLIFGETFSAGLEFGEYLGGSADAARVSRGETSIWPLSRLITE